MVAAEREPTWDTEFEFNATGGIIGELIRSYLRSFSSELWLRAKNGVTSSSDGYTGAEV